MMLALVDEIREKTAVPYRALSQTLRVPYGSLMRWRGRLRSQQPVVKVPGPRRIGIEAVPAFSRGLAAIVHHGKRSFGSGRLYECYRGVLSRQTIRDAIEYARRQAHQRLQMVQQQLHWLVPGSVWSMDMFEYDRDRDGRRVFIHQAQDMASRYKLPPLGGVCPCGEEIAAHLQAMIDEQGAPLFMKRDNGGNYNHQAVDDVLAENLILPINSPCSYPQYNGGIEHAQGELKRRIRLKLQAAGGMFLRNTIEPCAQAAAQELNHMPRQVLQGRTACQRFHGSRKVVLNRMERKDIYDCVNRMTCAILASMDRQEPITAETAWRLAAAYWLQANGFLLVSVNGKVSPSFTPVLDS
jgi:transposase InsO family protein